MAAPVQIPTDSATFSLGLSWDANLSAQRPTDLDLACLMIDGNGLIIDACFFNNQNAGFGSMTHSGDSTTGVPPGGIAEAITIAPALIPPHAYAMVFCVMCTNSGDFSSCESALVHLATPNGPLLHPLAIGSLAGQRATFAVLGISRRSQQGLWAFEPVLYGFPAPVRAFTQVFDQILAMIAIDPAIAAQLARHQPVFDVKKGESVVLPVGLKDVIFGLGWDSRVDVDSSCIGLDYHGRLVNKVWYADLNYKDIIVHTGDNRTGIGSGDDEQIKVKMHKIPINCQALFFVVNVFSGAAGFSDVKGEYCTLRAGGKEIARFKSLDSTTGNHNGIVLIALFRDPAFPTRWIFTAPALPAAGRTCNDLIDECQMVQVKFLNRGAVPQGWVPPPGPHNLVPVPVLKADISILKAVGLKAMDSNGFSDPYIKVYDDGKEVLKTKCHKKTLNPVWEKENFTVTFDSSGTADLKFKVYDKDTFRDDKIGTVKFKWNWLQLLDSQEVVLPIMNKKFQHGLLHFTVTKRPSAQW